MKRWVIVSVGLAMLAVVGIIFIWSGKLTLHKTNDTANSGHHRTQTASQNNPKKQPIDTTQSPTITCDKLLTTAQATNLLGGKPTLGTTNDTPNTQNPHFTIDTCTYTHSSQIIRVVAYSANDSVGTADNKRVFGTGKPKDAVIVQGYGNAAFWEQNSGVLNILRGNNWYEISNGAGETTSVTQAEQVAHVVLGNLT